MKKIIAINASPRQNWNTDLMVREAAKGAREAGAEVEVIQLYKLKNTHPCMSCFGCKLEKNLGKCVYPDDFAPVLQSIREADGLILGTPIYLGDITAGLRALYERLIFQKVTYRTDKIYYDDSQIPVLFVITSNAPLFTFEDEGYAQMIDHYQKELNRAVGPTSVVIADETMQVNDYEKYNWTRFDYEDRRRRRREVFPEHLKKAYEIGATLVK